MDIEHIRKLASLASGKELLEKLSAPVIPSPLTATLLHKAAECDVRFLKIAAWMNTGDTLEAYEALTGRNVEQE